MTYVALLRGIGPGNPNMTNVKLRGVFESLGYDSVRSVISSGNVVFCTKETDSSQLEHTIQQALHDQLGIPGGTIIRTLPQLERITSKRPFGDQRHDPMHYQLVTFLKLPSKGSFDSTDVAYQSSDYICTSTDTSVVKTPDIMRRLEKVYGKDITSRTYQTVERIIKVMQ